MYTIYNAIVIFLSVILSPLIFSAMFIKPKFRAGFWKKLGFYGIEASNKKSIWFHAVSVGEVNAIEPLVKRARETFPDYKIIITTVTKTGQDVAKSKFFKTADVISYFPFDNFFSIGRAIKAFNPKVVVIAETEIWPAFCHKIKKNEIPLVLVNGRISPNSYKGYKKFRFFFKKVLSNFSLILMQTPEDQSRIIDIGANPLITEVMGNLKFDMAGVLSKEEIKHLKNSLKSNDYKVIIAGSTHKGEDQIILNVFKKLKVEFNDLKLMIAPRHPERNCEVIKFICETGFKVGLRSKHSNFKHTDIILLNTMGELGKLYSVAKLAFIGGSFSGTGGHNPLEPAVYGVPTVSGADVYNFKDIYAYMKNEQAAFICGNEHELSQKIRELLKNKDLYENSSLACFNIFEKNKGALDFAIEKLKFYLR